MKEPKDLEIKIGSKEEAAWTSVFEKASESIMQNKIESELNEIVVEYAKKRIAEEKEKFK